MANKRVSELNALTVGDLSSTDLLLVSDVTAQESKKLTLGDLSGYLLAGGNLSGSFYGTSSWAYNAQTASYIALADSASYAKTASYLLNNSAVTPGASYDISASWASASLSSSLAKTASYVEFSVNSLSSSWTTRSIYCQTASFLYYTDGVNNGTAYYSIYSTQAVSASFATTASYVNSVFVDGGTFRITSSWASSSISSSYAKTSSRALLADTATTANTANSSVYSSIATYANNGIGFRTASYFSTAQVSNGGSADSPEDILESWITASATKDAPTLLINMCISAGGNTAVGLWRSSSVDVPLIKTIGQTSVETTGSVTTISATYMDYLPAVLTGETVYYRGRAYPNKTGNYHINRDMDDTKFGTSSISVIEF